MSAPAPLLRRAWRHGLWRVERGRTALADRLRRGGRTVIMTPPYGPRLGNFLYFWLAAVERTAAGLPTVVLTSPEMTRWWDALPAVRPLCIDASELRFHDRREWDGAFYYQRFGVDFSLDTLQSFIRERLAPLVVPDPTDRIVINVRRGDYYAQPHLRLRYGFDQVAYVDAALGLLGPADAALVVSDDESWCRAHLPAVLDHRFARVDYLAPDPLPNLVALGGARRLVGTNSTFSYWGAYIAGVTHPDAQVIMPAVHDRVLHTGRAYQLDPRWTALDGVREDD